MRAREHTDQEFEQELRHLREQLLLMGQPRRGNHQRQPCAPWWSADSELATADHRSRPRGRIGLEIEIDGPMSTDFCAPVSRWPRTNAPSFTYGASKQSPTWNAWVIWA